MSLPISEFDRLRLENDPNRPDEDTLDESELYIPQNSCSDDDKEAALRAELKSIKEMNAVIEGVVISLGNARGNMENVARTVSSASTLLDTWTRILSQTEHNRRLILDSSWQGASQDMIDIENESRLRQEEADRKELELQQRQQMLARKAEEVERKNAARTTSSVRGRRGLVRAQARGTSRLPASSRPAAQTTLGRSPSLRGTSASGRGTSNIARSSGIARGRGRVRGP
ncbi:hypothetical protein FQN57_000065 [Myotisia sp. PD_48]|nr:hypothetical protein FQN57_000065 [Myotisia sp. PD_48]